MVITFNRATITLTGDALLILLQFRVERLQANGYGIEPATLDLSFQSGTSHH